MLDPNFVAPFSGHVVIRDIASVVSVEVMNSKSALFLQDSQCLHYINPLQVYTISFCHSDSLYWFYGFIHIIMTKHPIWQTLHFELCLVCYYMNQTQAALGPFIILLQLFHLVTTHWYLIIWYLLALIFSSFLTIITWTSSFYTRGKTSGVQKCLLHQRFLGDTAEIKGIG